MNNKVVGGVVIVLLAVTGFLLVQNHELHKKVDELSKAKEEVTVTAPVIHEPGRPNPAGASPFDKPNVDPLADEVIPGDTGNKMPLTSIKFEKLAHNFGRIADGDVVTTQFRFTNTGDKPLLIIHAQGSCGCTVPRWPRELIKKGQSDVINVQFDSHGKSGETEKTVTVETNTTPRKTVLSIKSTVIPKDK